MDRSQQGRSVQFALLHDGFVKGMLGVTLWTPLAMIELN